MILDSSKFFFSTLFAVVMLIGSIPPLEAQSVEQDAVRTAFEEYRAALMSGVGYEAVAFVDSRTIAFYDRMLQKVKKADSAEIAGFPLLDKLIIASVRYRAPLPQVLLFEGKDLFVYAVTNGLVGKGLMANATIGNVQVDNTVAKGQYVNSGVESSLYFDFYKEEGTWKVNLTSVFPSSNRALKKMVTESGLTEHEFILNTLELLTGIRPEGSIWQPLLK